MRGDDPQDRVDRFIRYGLPLTVFILAVFLIIHFLIK